MTAWTPDNDPLLQRRMGKTLEELGELTAVCARIQIQGRNSIDPSSGKANWVRLHNEMADVLAQLECNMESLEMSRVAILSRKCMKIGQMAEWEHLLVSHAKRNSL